MPPQGINAHIISATTFKQKTENLTDDAIRINNNTADAACDTTRKWTIVWSMVIYFIIFHIGAFYGIYLTITNKIMLSTTVFWYLLEHILGTTGVTASAHRLWAHRSYKARWPLRLCLMLANCLVLQGHLISWVRDHRMHHRYSETDADPHNSSRGFFFSHIGWLMLRKHPDIKAKGHTIDMTDVYADPILQFQKKYYFPLAIVLNALPVYIPTLWGESLWNAFFTCFVLRYVLLLHYTFLVNSAAHVWGSKPYNKSIAPSENKIVSWFAMGEGFHNFHHCFPWDYKTAELGNYSLNITKLFIDVMAKIGLAYDLKTVAPEVIKNRMKRTGDGQN